MKYLYRVKVCSKNRDYVRNGIQTQSNNCIQLKLGQCIQNLIQIKDNGYYNDIQQKDLIIDGIIYFSSKFKSRILLIKINDDVECALQLNQNTKFLVDYMIVDFYCTPLLRVNIENLQTIFIQMIEKSKIRQILLDKSLGQILKVDGPVESIQNEEQLSNLQAFHQHFHTTAKREHSATSRLRNKIEKTQDEFWKCIRPRTPSVSINCRQRVTIFEEQRDFQLQQATNVVIPWEPIKKHIPLDKQTRRKSWYTQAIMPDLNCDPPKPKTICYVNYSKASFNKQRPTSQYHIDDRKATQTYLHLKPNFQRRNMDFARLVDRNNASPYINKF